MKTVIAVLCLIGAILLNSCEPAVTFDKPQPESVPVLSTFPKQLHGVYADSGRTSFLKVSDKLITWRYEFDMIEHKDSIGSANKLTGDTLVDENGVKEKITFKEDSIIRHVVQTDTLFYLSDKEVLKKFKGKYFISTQYDENKWEVNMFSFSKNRLTFSAVTEDNAIDKMREITERPNDTVTYFSPTKSQFRRFVKHKVFSPVESFVKIN